MPLTHAILVSLSEQPGSGYELARRFDRSIGYFWAATHQQLYRTLHRMETDHWLHADVIEQSGRPDKKVYRVTTDGRAELSRWIVAPLVGRGGPVSDGCTRELAVKIRGLAHGGPACLEAVRSQVVALRTERTQLLTAYQGFAARQFAPTSDLTGAALHQYLVLRAGIRAEEGLVGWLDEVSAALGVPGA